MINSIEEIKAGAKVRIYASGEYFMMVGVVIQITGKVAHVYVADAESLVAVDVVELQKI